MAIMIPPDIDPEIKSTAEKRIFYLLRNDPDTQKWIVLHSLGLSRHARKRFGEIDFVVLVPNGAVVCLEVKGGRISCHNGIWESMDRGGQAHRLKESPFLQARGGMFALQDIIRSEAPDGVRLSQLAFTYGVLLPDIEWNHSGPEWEGWQLFDTSFAAPISHFIQNLIARSNERQRFDPPTQSDVKKLRNFLRPNFEYITRPSLQMAHIEEELLRLTQDQYAILDGLERNPRLVIEGAAGTGKTLIALEAARREAARGRKVLFLCYNKFLAYWIQQNLQSYPYKGNITCGNFHKVMESFIVKGNKYKEFQSAREAAQRSNRLNAFYKEDYPLFAFEAIAECAPELSDVLLLDEGQDLLQDDNLTIFDYLLKGGLAGGRWTIFADFNRQAIYAGGEPSEEMRNRLEHRASFTSYELRLNCRNAPRVGRESALMSGFETLPFSLLREGEGHVDYRFWSNDNKQRKLLAEILRQLTDDGFRAEEIIILSKRRRENSCLSGPFPELPKELSIVDLNEANLITPQPGQIRFATLFSYKGLESRAVILMDVDQLDDEREEVTNEICSQLYVAMSRASSCLYVLLRDNVRREYEDRVRSSIRSQLQGKA